MRSGYHIRPASSAEEDGKRILEFTDSQLPYLARIGSGDQWGTGSVSTREASQQKYKNLIERSEKTQTWGEDWMQVFVLEIEVELEDKWGRLPVAAMILEARSSEYTRPVLPEQDDGNPFVYVRYLVTDRRVGSLSKGSGQVLLNHADAVARSLNIGRLCLDGWNGNDYLLVRYYEKQGFVRLGDVIDEPD